MVENAISRTNAIKLRKRLTEQAEAESQIGKPLIHPDKKQLIAFLINKGQGFRDLLFHPELSPDGARCALENGLKGIAIDSLGINPFHDETQETHKVLLEGNQIAVIEGVDLRPDPTWGGMLSGSGRSYMFLSPLMSVWPGLALMIVVYGLNIFGDALRDLLDPRLRGATGRYGGFLARSRQKRAL